MYINKKHNFFPRHSSAWEPTVWYLWCELSCLGSQVWGKIHSWDRIFRPFKEPRNRFPAWRVGTKTLLVLPARQAT